MICEILGAWVDVCYLYDCNTASISYWSIHQRVIQSISRNDFVYLLWTDGHAPLNKANTLRRTGPGARLDQRTGRECRSTIR